MYILSRAIGSLNARTCVQVYVSILKTETAQHVIKHLDLWPRQLLTSCEELKLYVVDVTARAVGPHERALVRQHHRRAVQEQHSRLDV